MSGATGRNSTVTYGDICKNTHTNCISAHYYIFEYINHYVNPYVTNEFEKNLRGTKQLDATVPMQFLRYKLRIAGFTYLCIFEYTMHKH